MLALAFGIQGAWRSARAAQRRASQLADYALREADQIQAVAERLNKHGFELQSTSSTVLPRLERIGMLLQTPLVAASLPWLVRRVLGRPLKRRR